MNWRLLDRWATIATIALYVAAIGTLVIVLGESLLPAGSPAQTTFRNVAEYLVRLGNIGSGMIMTVILFILLGVGTAMLLFKAYDQFQENRKRRARERAEAIAEGRAEGRAEARAEIIEQLKARGLDVDELIPPDETESNRPGWLFP